MLLTHSLIVSHSMKDTPISEILERANWPTCVCMGVWLFVCRVEVEFAQRVEKCRTIKRLQEASIQSNPGV